MQSGASDIQIELVRDRRGLREFVQLPRGLYRDHPDYVPPLDIEQMSLIDPKKSSFFKHGYAAFWIARRGGTPVGRISAQIDFLARQPDGARLGFFGCFDAIDDAAVAKPLFLAAEQWLREQGCERMRGPFMMSINGQSGLLASGRDHRPMVGMPWHPEYLAGLVESCACRVVQVFSSYAVDYQYVGRVVRPAAELKDFITVRSMDMSRLSDETEICRRMFNDFWKDNWGFVELSRADAEGMLTELKPLLFEDLTFVVEHEGKPIGFMLVLPNVYDVAGDLGAAPSIIGWLRFLWRVWKRQYTSCRILLMGFSSAAPIMVRARAVERMFAEAIARARRYRDDGFVEAGWILSDNRPMLAVLNKYGAKPVRSYNIYEKNL
jgi:hypothetical protein